MLVFDVADVGGGVDELLIERAPVGAEGLDLELELGLGFQAARCWARAASSSWSCCLSALRSGFAGVPGAGTTDGEGTCGEGTWAAGLSES